VQSWVDAAGVGLEDRGAVAGGETYRRVSSKWWPVCGSIPRTAPTISEPNRMLSTPMTSKSRLMPGWW
jgi:hypothetical protein